MNIIKIEELNRLIITNKVQFSKTLQEYNYNNEYLKDKDFGDFYKFYLILSHFELVFNDGSLSIEDVFYDRYYWFSLFLKIFQIKYGKNSELEQYHFKLIEEMDNNITIDWDRLKRIDEESDSEAKNIIRA
jgi:hypothetical protein